MHSTHYAHICITQKQQEVDHYMTVAIQKFWTGEGERVNVSAPSYFIANARSELYAFYTEKGDLPGGHFEGERRSHCWKADWTHIGRAFPLLTCLRTHYGRHCEPFSGPKCSRVQDFAYTISTFSGDDTPADSHRSVPGARTQTPFPLGSPAFPMFLLHETTTTCTQWTIRALYRKRDLLKKWKPMGGKAEALPPLNPPSIITRGLLHTRSQSPEINACQ